MLFTANLLAVAIDCIKQEHFDCVNKSTSNHSNTHFLLSVVARKNFLHKSTVVTTNVSIDLQIALFEYLIFRVSETCYEK